MGCDVLVLRVVDVAVLVLVIVLVVVVVHVVPVRVLTIAAHLTNSDRSSFDDSIFGGQALTTCLPPLTCQTESSLN